MNKIKDLFSTPMRAMVTTLVIVAVIGLLSISAVFAAIYINNQEEKAERIAVENTAAKDDVVVEEDQPEDGSQEDQSAPETESNVQTEGEADTADVQDKQAANDAGSGKISEKKAESIALKDAGLSSSQVSRLYSYYEMDDGIAQYEVQFFKDAMEYDYSIDASTGAIIEKDVESIYD